MKIFWKSIAYALFPLFLASISLTTNATSGPYYNIAHMANANQLVEWAIAKGANAIEADLNFLNDGTPQRFYHGFPCDCTVAVLARVGMEICEQSTSYYQACQREQSAQEYFIHMAQQPVALFIIDNKVSSLNEEAKKKAGKALVNFLNIFLFERGYQGSVVIGTAKLADKAFIKSAAETAKESKYKNRIYFTFDQESRNTRETLKTLATISQNRVYGVGESAASPKTFYSEIGQASLNERNGFHGLTYIWTLDKPASMQNYLNMGARGIITNNPGKLFELLTKARLAKPSDLIPVATTDEIK